MMEKKKKKKHTFSKKELIAIDSSVSILYST